MRGLTLLLVIPAVLAKVIHPVPDPYRWDESFTVEIPRLDDEHRGLFNALLKIERDNTEENIADAVVKYTDHFVTEEAMFEQTMSEEYVEQHKKKHEEFLSRAEKWDAPVPDSEISWAENWLVQHIKNTDFQYVGLMPHQVPRPYSWDESFDVFYKEINDEHKSIFDAIREVEHNPKGANELEDLKFKLRAHFDEEQGYFCASDTYQDCEEHKDKHDSFYRKVYGMNTPVTPAEVYFVKNWFVQHIKNTDFAYKHKLNTYKHIVPEPYVWEESLQVFYKQIDDEHKVLFDAIRESTENPDDAGKYSYLKDKMKEHFDHEEAEFKKIPNFEEYINDHVGKHATFMQKLNDHSVPLDCDFVNFVQDWLVQHIRNTDFAYRGKMMHEVPSPFKWDESFMVFYNFVDTQHQGLFDCIRECGENPGNKEMYDNCKSLLRAHFDDEEFEFCKVKEYDCYGHYLKHFNFMTKFQEASVPLDSTTIDFAMNWLTQHIKNTDHAYKGKLLLRRTYPVPEPYVWDESFTVEIDEMDDQHKVLFDAVEALGANPGDKSAWEHTVKVFNDHFSDEEDLFTLIHDNKHDIADHRHRHQGLMKTIAGATIPISQEMIQFVKNWLVQHIKNTDFSYMGKMPKVHPIPEPYQWDASFAVFYPQMDEDHKELFDCISKIAANTNDDGLLKTCVDIYVDHFNREQNLFTKSGTYPDEEAYQHINKHDAFLATMKDLNTPVPDYWLSYAKNWLTQHIKNTDFRYKGKMPYEVPNPYEWDESFEVFYKNLDEEHKVLFDAMRQLEDHPDDIDILNHNRDVYHEHFEYEESQFLECGEPCQGDAHKKKHDTFFRTLTWVTTPVSKDYMEFAKNWLVQHIKNTDFLYRTKLPTQHTVPHPYIWNEEFAVFYKQLDDEHKGLFDGLRAVEESPNSRRSVQKLKTIMRNHFIYEEKEICSSPNIEWEYCKDHKRKHVQFSERLAKMEAPVSNKDIMYAQDWLANHIKNTDFAYKGKLTHPVPEPYVWDTTFAVDYEDLDSQHEKIFAAVYELSKDPVNAGTLDKLKDLLNEHFVYEEAKFCAVKGFNCVDHKMKHYKFITRFNDLKVPVNCDTINWTKNWFAQHVKNTDHQYKNRL